MSYLVQATATAKLMTIIIWLVLRAGKMNQIL